jgi:hypothetical protein
MQESRKKRSFSFIDIQKQSFYNWEYLFSRKIFGQKWVWAGRTPPAHPIFAPFSTLD